MNIAMQTQSSMIGFEPVSTRGSHCGASRALLHWTQRITLFSLFQFEQSQCLGCHVACAEAVYEPAASVCIDELSARAGCTMARLGPRYSGMLTSTIKVSLTL